ncbi:MAG: response regulator [Deltaproteobacteria bacterium]|nr:response regulator [Deltaproteobacteria bacterium]
MNELKNNTGQHETGRTKVLIVDDDQRLQDVVREFLENYNYEIHSLGSGSVLAQALEEIGPDILLLDVMLPGEDGFTLLRELRAHSRLPVIMLTACGGDIDRITGLEIGADDYLPKPFNPRELLARIKAVLRRAPPVSAGQPEQAEGAETAKNELAGPDGLIQAGSFVLDTRRQLLKRGGEALELSTTEYRILLAFMGRPGEVLARERVLALAFGEEHYVSDRNIDVYISRLRAILRRMGETDTRIRTVWGSGYSWVPEGAATGTSS